MLGFDGLEFVVWFEVSGCRFKCSNFTLPTSILVLPISHLEFGIWCLVLRLRSAGQICYLQLPQPTLTIQTSVLDGFPDMVAVNVFLVFQIRNGPS